MPRSQIAEDIEGGQEQDHVTRRQPSAASMSQAGMSENSHDHERCSRSSSNSHYFAFAGGLVVMRGEGHGRHRPSLFGSWEFS